MSVQETVSQPAGPDQLPIWFILGISGAGKSHFCQWLQAAKGWLHLDIDLYPKDGITEQGLRAEWNAFFHRKDPKELIRTLQSRGSVAGSKGVVLSFPGNAINVITAGHIQSCAQEVAWAFLTGDSRLCLQAFLDREQRTGRRLGHIHWVGNNKDLFPKLEQPVLRDYVVNVFNADGSRKSTDALYAEVSMLSR